MINLIFKLVILDIFRRSVSSVICVSLGIDSVYMLLIVSYYNPFCFYKVGSDVPSFILHFSKVNSLSLRSPHQSS